MADSYKGLVLDPFQREALDAIARGESVVVAAPTGAGKTVIAEYAIEKALREGRRVVYTAPIKALSNQKFRDFSALYPGDVGITTGDVSINPTARALIMTTEIFRNTIFDDPKRLEDVATVIYDEIHYMDDPERGTVWEESLIFAPASIKVVALSATIANLDEFADWLREVRGGEVKVVLEHKRPVPLSIYVATEKQGIHPWQQARGLRAGARFKERGRGRRADRFRHQGFEDRRSTQERVYRTLVRELRRRRELPCLFFLFSRDWCERVATACVDDDWFEGDETRRRAAIEELDRLCAAYSLDRGDPEVLKLRRLVSRGIAFHHAGLLPPLKEVVERLFGEHHIRILFATETFALGVNFPARSVSFEGLKKWNGVARVVLKTREFQQMAGRAGRRGIDTKGDVFVSYDPERDDAHVLESVLRGRVEPIESQFNLSYSTVLNLYRRLGDKIYSACAKSFANFRMKKRAPATFKDEGPLSDDEIKSVTEKHGGDGPVQNPGDERGGRWERHHGGKRKGRPGRRERAAMKEARLRGERGGHDRREGRWRGRRDRGQGKKGHFGHRDAPMPPVFHGPARYDDMVEQVRRKLDVLREFGYIQDRDLTEKGTFAASVYGHELEATELVFEGVLDRLSPAQIAVIATSVVHESRRDEVAGGIDPRQAVGDAFRFANKAVRALYDRELELRIRTPVRLLDWKLTGVVWAWAHEAEFAELRDLTDASDGDIVRSLRQAIQLLRLLLEPLQKLPVAAGPRVDLARRVQQALRLVKRGLIDAEWQIRKAAELEAERIREREAGITHEAPEDTAPPESGLGDASAPYQDLDRDPESLEREDSVSFEEDDAGDDEPEGERGEDESE